MTNRQIKFTVIAKKWFDRVNGNIYHSVRCIRHKDNAIVVGSFRYGYGEHYKQTALTVMAKAKWLPKKYRGVDDMCHHINAFDYERENKYPILWTVSDGLKRECVANGQI